MSVPVSNGSLNPPLTFSGKRREQLLEDGAFLKDLVARYRAELIIPAKPELCALTDKHIAPHLDAIVRDMLELRVETDAHFREQIAGRLGAMPQADEGMAAQPVTYPISYCLEITRYMLMLMSREPVPTHMHGLRAIHDFVRAGGPVKRVWGALRGGYFQNAIQVGTFYLDVANDTVNPAKPKIELLPMADANFNNIGSYFEFARVGAAYWKCRTIPNRYFPNLAPFYPAIAFDKSGVARFESRNSFMFPMNIARRFEPARDFVLGDDVGGGTLDPYIDWLQRYAARDPRTSDRAHPLWFCRDADAELHESFRAIAAQDVQALTQSAKRALASDTHFLNIPELGGDALPHMNGAEV